jgi:Flp pilus assembly protein TadG
MLTRKTDSKRRGAAAVEMAVVSVLLFMMLFGIFEYGRLLYVMHVANNAARDTARFAVVHTNGGTMPGEPVTIATSDLVNILVTGQLGTLVEGSGMGGMDQNIQNFTVNIFAVDPVGLSQTPPVVQPMPNSSWTDAAYSQPIAVQITGNYTPVLPSLLFMNSTIPIQITVMSSSEAN